MTACAARIKPDVLACDREARKAELEDVELHNERLAFTMGMRADDLIGTGGGRWDAKMRRAGCGLAHSLAAWGCWACKVKRDAQQRAREAAVAAAGPAGAPQLSAAALRRRRKAAQQQWVDEEELAAVQPTAQHICGDCVTTTQASREEVVVPLRNLYEVLASLDRGGGGSEDSVKIAEQALHGARKKAEARGGEVDEDELHWTSQRAVYAAVLPAWKGGGGAPAKVVKSVATYIGAVQQIGLGCVARHRNAAESGHRFVRARHAAAGLMKLVLRSWREVAERANRSLRSPAVRIHARDHRRSERLESNKAARPQCLEWVRAGTSPDVWGTAAAAAQVVDRAELLRRKREANRRPTAEVRSWRLYDWCKWNLAYYRMVVQGVLAERLEAEERTRKRTARLAKLRRWVISAAAARQAAGETADDAPPTGGPQLSSRGRVIVPREHFSPNEGTVDTTRTRTYATRRPRVELEAARLARKWRRVNVVSGTESGRRLHELMVVTAAPGGLADRRGEG